MTILVTGGAGFIGSNFILNCLKKYDEKFINLDSLTYSGNLENLKSVEKKSNYEFVKGDIGDSNLVADLLKKYQPRAIINFLRRVMWIDPSMGQMILWRPTS